jgi:ATP-dependent helicase/DNAse subunit B
MVDYSQFLSDLQGTLDGIGLREPSLPGKPVLLVGRMVEARGLRLQAVALLGLSEGLFPANEHPDPFLDEALRAALGLDQRLQREQAGLFYQAVTRSNQHLLITRPYLSDDGEKWEESTFWKAIQRLFSANVTEMVRPDDPHPLVDAASTQELLFAAVRRRNIPQQYDFLNDRLNGLRHAREVLKARRAKHPNGPHDGFADLIIPLMIQKYSPSQTWSPSRLEYYGTCPYQFFIRTALGLEARALPQLGLNPGQLGSLLHKILEDTYRNAPDLQDAQGILACLDTVAEQVFANAPREFGFRPSPLWENEKAQLLEKLRKTVQAMAEDTEWTPIEFEMVFGKDNYPPLTIDLGGEILSIRGVVDRVDRNSAGQLRVVDYKSGGSHLTPTDLKDGHRLQLPIYALAARAARKLGTPVEGIYWKVLAGEAGTLRLSKFKTDTNQGVDAAIDVVISHLIRIVKGIRSAEFPPKTPRGGCPSYCPTAQWCWRYEPER